MKYAILSDIHGNLEALEAVISEIEQMEIDTILCLGDIVGYGPNPNECIDLIREKTEVALAGNHDYAPIGKMNITYFNPWARSAIEWTSDKLTEKSVEYLNNLPLKMEIDDFTIVHSTPFNPSDWNYVITIGDAAKNFAEFANQICFIGHSHVPMIVSLDKKGDYKVLKDNPLKIKDKTRYIVNVGSVGQPRDGNPNAAFGVLDKKAKNYELNRVEYDIEKTQNKIREARLPDFLANRLQVGQ